MGDNPLNLVVKGSGSPRDLTSRDLTMLIQEAEHVKTDCSSALAARARDSLAARYNVWSGQTADGRKHVADRLTGKVHPYPGASDARIPLVDFLVTFRVALCLAAATDASRSVAPMEVTDAGYSGRMQTLLKWVLDNQLGGTLHAELSRLLNWVESDTPGAAVMGVYWREETGTDIQRVTREDLISLLLQDSAEGIDPAMLEGAFSASDPGGDALAGIALAALFPALSPKDRRQAISDLRNTGVAEFPSPVLRYQGVEICAHRLNEDIFLPSNTVKDIQKAPVIFRREALTEVELRERVVTMGYAQDFVDTVCGVVDDRGTRRGGFIGQSWIDDSYQRANQALADLELTAGKPDRNRGLVEVLTAYYRAITDTGHAAVFCVPFSPLANMAAKPREICNYAHGKYPFVYFSSEYITNNLQTARSTAGRNYTDQTALKKLHDSGVNHAEMTALPAFLKRAGMTPETLDIGPLAENVVRTANAVETMPMPARAGGALEMMDRIERRAAQVNGIPHPEVPQEVTTVVQRHLVNNFLASYREVLVMVLQLCQEYMSPEMLAEVTGAKPDQSAIPSKESIRARFNLTVSFDPRVLSREYLADLMDFATKLVGLDTKGTVMRDRLVALITRALDPALADYALQPVEQADQKEVEQTKQDFAKIMSGVMPEMPEAGVNWQLRLQTLDQIKGANIFLDARMTPDAQQAEAQYRDWLMQGITQEENKQLGRLGTSPELDVEAAMQRAEGQAQ